jgi:hypothetical protein
MTNYPHSPGHADTGTSFAAAGFIAPHAPRLKELVVEALGVRPMTTVEIAETLELSYESIQPRTSELKALGLIRDGGLRGRSRNPKIAGIVWETVR